MLIVVESSFSSDIVYLMRFAPLHAPIAMQDYYCTLQKVLELVEDVDLHECVT